MTHRRALGIVLVASALAAGCNAAADTVRSGEGSSPATTPTAIDPQGSPDPRLAGYTQLLSFDPLEGWFWVPVVAGDQLLDQVQGAYWVLSGDADIPTISGDDGCNRFDAQDGAGAEATRLVDGRLVNYRSETTLVECASELHLGFQPADGARFWLHESGERLIVTTGSTDTYVLFVRQSMMPLRAAPAVQAQRDAEFAAQEAERAREEQERQAQIDADRERLRVELPAARKRWDAVRITSYELRFVDACLECGSFPQDIDNVTPINIVTVVDGVADSPWNDAVTGATVDAWLDYLDALLDSAYWISAEFDPEVGFPTALRVVNRVYDGPENPDPYDDFLFRGVEVVPAG